MFGNRIQGGVSTGLTQRRMAKEESASNLDGQENTAASRGQILHLCISYPESQLSDRAFWMLDCKP